MALALQDTGDVTARLVRGEGDGQVLGGTSWHGDAVKPRRLEDARFLKRLPAAERLGARAAGVRGRGRSLFYRHGAVNGAVDSGIRSRLEHLRQDLGVKGREWALLRRRYEAGDAAIWIETHGVFEVSEGVARRGDEDALLGHREVIDLQKAPGPVDQVAAHGIGASK